MGLTTRKPETTIEEMLNAIGDSLSDLASCDDEEDLEDEEEEEEEDTELGKLIKEAEPGWVMGTISNAIQQRMQRNKQQQMELDELTQPGLGHTPAYFGGRQMKYRLAQLKIAAVVKPRADDVGTAPAQTTIGKLIEPRDIIPRISQMPQGTSHPGSSHRMLDSEEPQFHKHRASLLPCAAPGLSPSRTVTRVGHVSFDLCILPS